MTDTPVTYADMPSEDAFLSEIDAQASADIMSIPTGNTIDGDAAFRAKLGAPKTMSALSPEDREIVAERLNQIPLPLRNGKEAELVQQFIAEKVRALRVTQGPGPNANALTQEKWLLAREADELDRQQDAIIAELSEVSSYNPETGAPILRHPVGSQKRNALDAELMRLNTLATNIRKGTEGRERLEHARKQALADAQKRWTEIHIAHEAKRRAEANAVEEQIAKRAAMMGKRLSDTNV